MIIISLNHLNRLLTLLFHNNSHCPFSIEQLAFSNLFVLQRMAQLRTLHPSLTFPLTALEQFSMSELALRTP